MVDQRGRDSPPTFRISPHVAGFRYHALVTEAVEVPSKLVFDASKEGDHLRTGSDGVSVLIPAGLYGFSRVEDRDKFCRRANAAADVEEHKIAFPVTVPNLYLIDEPPMTAISFHDPATGPVAK